MLLRTRSILAQASILVLITLARSQENDAEYNVEDEAEDHSAYSGEGHQHPDYSKYYALDSPQNSAQIQGRSDTGFVAPIEFSNFFGSPQFDFGAATANQEILKPLAADIKQEANANGFVSDKDFKGGFAEYDANGFGVQDYFEQAQKQEQKAEDDDEESVEAKPGPSYISHRVPAKKGRYESQVENLKDSPSKFESTRIKNFKAEDEDEAVDEREEIKSNYGFKPSPSTALNLAEFQPTNPSKILEDVVAKSVPYNPEYYKQFTTNAQPQVTPYQKYSFQPAASNFGLKDASILNAFQSTAVPFNPSYGKVAATAATNYEFQPSEIVYQNLKGRECVKINKEVSDNGGKFKKQPMNCYVCKDPKSGGKYEQCSYTNEPNPKSYYTSTSQSYGTPEGHRNKRDEQKSYKDPYEEIKAASHDYFSKPEEFNSEYYKAPDFSTLSEEYHYPEISNEKESEDKSYSEIQSEQLIKKGENCHKSHKNGVTCTVCKDPKTGANFEQCSYESAPNEKQYAYVKESKFDGDGNPIEEKVSGTVPQSVDEKEESFAPLRRSGDAEEADEAEETRTSEEKKEDEPKSSKLIDDTSYEVPRHFAESTYKQHKAGVRGLDPALYGGGSSEKSEESETAPQKFTNMDEYHLKLFPQFSNQETKQEESRTQPDGSYFEDLSGKKDVEKVLEEFTKKDRSNCKQIRKKGMTCYLCVDKKGIQQEECMYVSESRPQSSHVAYHEVQHLKVPEKAALVNAPQAASESNPEEAASSESQKRKKFFKKAVSDVAAAVDSEANASTNVETRIKFQPSAAASKKVYRKVPKNKRDAEPDEERDKYKLDESQDPQPLFDVNDEGGLYTAETQQVYSEALGLSLPRYMLEKTYLERDFDKTVSEE